MRPWRRAAEVAVPGVALVTRLGQDYARRWEELNRRALRNPTDGALWVVIGDSLSVGVGAETFEQGWVVRAAVSLADSRPVRVVNLAAIGATTHDVVERQLPQLRDLDAAVVTVLVGANDFMTWRFGGLHGRYRQIIEEVPCATVVAELPQPLGPARRVNRELRQAAAAGRLRTVSLRTAALPGRGLRAADHVHPNSRGHAQFADRFVPQLERLLSEQV